MPVKYLSIYWKVCYFFHIFLVLQCNSVILHYFWVGMVPYRSWSWIPWCLWMVDGATSDHGSCTLAKSSFDEFGQYRHRVLVNHHSYFARHKVIKMAPPCVYIVHTQSPTDPGICATHTTNKNIVWKFKSIFSHQWPLTPNHPDHTGSTYNVMIEWEEGDTTNEPLRVISKF